MKKFLKDIFNKGNFKDYFKRNKIFLLVSALIIILSLLLGYYNSTDYSGITHPILNNINMLQYNLDFTSGFVSIFTNNLINTLTIIGGGISFSLLSLSMVISNTVFVGTLFSISENLFGNIITYGLIESVLYIFALTGAFLVTKMEVRFILALFRGKFNEIIKKLKVPFKDLILTIVFIAILLVIMSLLQIILL